MILRIATASILLALLGGPAGAETIDGDKIIIIDGDTVALPCVRPGPGCSERIRLTAIDAPETWHPHCDDELQAGLMAADRLREILRGHQVTITRAGRLDRYGRTLADIATGEGDAGELLMREGMALPYRPGSRAHAERVAHWCGAGR